jgi:hypothetical protein
MTSIAYPYLVPEIKYATLSQDIVTKYKYTYVAYASYNFQPVTSGVTYSGAVSLTKNYSDSISNYRYFIYSFFETNNYLDSTSSIQKSEPSLIITGNKQSTSGTEFNWWFRNIGVTLNTGGTLRFVIFFYTPELIGNIKSLVTQPLVSTSNGISKNTEFLSNFFTGNTGKYDVANFFPLISYTSYTQGSSSTGINTTINIVDYGTTNYTVLYELSIDAAPTTIQTKNLSMTIYTDKKLSSSFRFYFVNNTGIELPPPFVINFIIFYNGP